MMGQRILLVLVAAVIAFGYWAMDQYRIQQEANRHAMLCASYQSDMVKLYDALAQADTSASRGFAATKTIQRIEKLDAVIDGEGC